MSRIFSPVVRTPALPSSAASAASHDDREWSIAADHLAPPSLSQLAALTAVPSGMVSVMGARRKKTAKGKLVKDGQIVSKFFDALGARPAPTNGISLEQSIQFELTYTFRDFIVSSATASLPTYAAAYVQLAAFSGATSILAVFDQYRFDQVEAWIECTTPNNAVAFPEVITAVDLDDSNVPTGLGPVQDHQGAISGVGPGGHYHKWKPHMAVSTFSGAFTSYGNVVAGWIDSGSPSVQHYGLKAATISNGAAVTYDITLRAVVSFRAPAIN